MNNCVGNELMSKRFANPFTFPTCSFTDLASQLVTRRPSFCEESVCYVMILILYIGVLHAALNGLSKDAGHNKWGYKIKMNGEGVSLAEGLESEMDRKTTPRAHSIVSITGYGM